jgi:outer membrane protein assembly factor BamE
MALHRSLILALLAAATLLGGCVYRPDIQQGNLLTIKDIDQVTVGMTRSQVRFLLGTPMVSDPFAPHRWDYVYRMQRGRDERVSTAHFVVYFEGDKVVRLETLDAPEPAGLPQRKKGKKQQPPAESAPAAPAAPATEAPPPAGS